MRGVLVITAFVFGLSSCLLAQVNYQQEYASGKTFFREGKYNLAMEVFKKLVPNNKENPFTEYASFYYALSAYNQGYKSVAKDMFAQIKSLYPSWDNIDEVNLWLSKLHFENKEYFQAMRVLTSMKSTKLRKDAQTLKRVAMDSVTDLATLKSLGQTYPEDEIVGRQLALALSKDQTTDENRLMLETLIDRFRLKKSDFIEEAPKSFTKDQYAVSVLFPFIVRTIDPTPSMKRNQFVIDLYQGMQLAVDTLRTMGVKIDLRAYDTERSTSRTKKIVALPELASSDLIVSPLFYDMNKVVQEYAHEQKINTFNPVSNNSDFISGNPYGFLFLPSNEMIGQESARFLSADSVRKKCIVFYGESVQDSIMAANFIQTARKTKLEIVMAPMIRKSNSSRILEILQTPTEFDDLKYPTQFTLPKDSLDCIFVASNDPLLYAKVLSSVETRRDSIIVVGSEAWLDQQSVDYEKYQSLGVVLYAPTFTSYNNLWYKAFHRAFIRKHGRISASSAYTDYARVGYEFMLFVGHSLKKYGVYFQEGLNKEPMKGFMYQKFDFRDSNVNRNVQFIKVVDGRLQVLDWKKADD